MINDLKITDACFSFSCPNLCVMLKYYTAVQHVVDVTMNDGKRKSNGSFVLVLFTL